MAFWLGVGVGILLGIVLTLLCAFIGYCISERYSVMDLRKNAKSRPRWMDGP